MTDADGVGALAGLRVVDLAGTVATGYCGKLFADHGAEVVNVEPPEGFPTRRLAPFVGATGRSALHEYLSAGKRSVAIGSAGFTGATSAALCASADLVLDDGTHAPHAPSRVRMDVTWFGRNGPYANHAGSDGVCFALTGLTRGIGRAEGPPLIPTGYQAQIVGGITAYIGALGHVLARVLDPGHAPMRLETSILEAVICFTEVGAVGFHTTGITGTRLGINRLPPTYPLGIFPCRDGWLGVTVLTPGQWQAFCALLDLGELAQVPRYHATLERFADAAVIEPLVRARLRERSAHETFVAGQRAGVPLALVPTMAELFAVDQYVAREVFAPLEYGEAPAYPVPVVPFRLRRTPSRRGGRVSALGADTANVLNGLSNGATGDWASASASSVPADAGRAPLAGVRIVDLSMGWAGPQATRHLADLGADVIKVESCERFDWWRSWEATPEWIADAGAEKSVQFNTMNRNKRAVTLDLEASEGRALLLRLVAGAHAVIENYSAGVLPKLKLDYPELVKVNPALVMVSMPAFGASGPWHHFRAYGSTVEHASGMPHLNGEADDPPAMHHVAYGDPVGGLNGAAALLTAIHHLLRTGEGQFVDLSQAECLFPLAIHGILEQSANGVAPARVGNANPRFAPHGVYPAAGDDAWINVQVFDEPQWQALAAVAGAALAAFGELPDRLARRAELDRALAAWTRGFDAADLATRLRAAGVPAAPVLSAGTLLTDPHLAARGYWQWLDRAVVGRQPQPSAPYRALTGPFAIRAPAPTLGQHNAEVLGEGLGLAASEIRALEEAGIIGSVPRMRGSGRMRAATQRDGTMTMPVAPGG
jgi:crotonobetainyl-CoA:carnitine CoA-transferase CaiB-like acyl-CoA transferase